jgi:hypothetical protein
MLIYNNQSKEERRGNREKSIFHVVAFGRESGIAVAGETGHRAQFVAQG